MKVGLAHEHRNNRHKIANYLRKLQTPNSGVILPLSCASTPARELFKNHNRLIKLFGLANSKTIPVLLNSPL